MEAMLECIQISHSNTWSRDPMMQLKVTALLSPELCLFQLNFRHFVFLCTAMVKVKLTTLIAQQPYDLNLLQINFPGLDESDVAHFLCSLRRLNQIAEVQKSRKPLLHGKKIKLMCFASVNKVRVLVDAEYTYMNPALSLVTMAMMKKFNKDGAWIWNTYQCYLKEIS
ncbi:hypothetical protein F7725_014236 [Dissostichus mawsoni]|uniref:Proline dehydrogenase n=1 Tax=Dissostichus mawsoni TaxID=36200 RepID=A0A7J5YZP8_DISMA|nr:hypothetical protein F7725_014236 [Dissostichus mawsoni]